MMKTFSQLTLVLLILVAFISCKDDPDPSAGTGTLAIHIVPLYEGVPIATFHPVGYENNQRVEFSHLSVMFSDVRLYDGTSEEYLDDVEIASLSFDDAQAAEEGYVMTLPDIPEGSYDGIRFGVGLPRDVNHKLPTDFPSTHPLSSSGYYWYAWNSFIFTKTEGRIDTLGNGPLDMGFAFHTGADALYRAVEGPIPVLIEDGQRTDIRIRIDYKDLLSGLDIKSDPQNHNPEDSVQILRIVNNLQNALTLSQ